MRTRMVWIGATLLLACSPDVSDNESSRCDENKQCAQGAVCYRGFCVSDADASDMEESGPTAQPAQSASGRSGAGAARASGAGVQPSATSGVQPSATSGAADDAGVASAVASGAADEPGVASAGTSGAADEPGARSPVIAGAANDAGVRSSSAMGGAAGGASASGAAPSSAVAVTPPVPVTPPVAVTPPAAVPARSVDAGAAPVTAGDAGTPRGNPAPSTSQPAADAGVGASSGTPPANSKVDAAVPAPSNPGQIPPVLNPCKFSKCCMDAIKVLRKESDTSRSNDASRGASDPTCICDPSELKLAVACGLLGASGQGP